MTFPPGGMGAVSVEGHRTAHGLGEQSRGAGGSSSLGTPSQQDGQEELLDPCGLAAPLRALCPDPGRAPQPPPRGPQAPSH